MGPLEGRRLLVTYRCAMVPVIVALRSRTLVEMVVADFNRISNY